MAATLTIPDYATSLEGSSHDRSVFVIRSSLSALMPVYVRGPAQRVRPGGVTADRPGSEWRSSVGGCVGMLMPAGGAAGSSGTAARPDTHPAAAAASAGRLQ